MMNHILEKFENDDFNLAIEKTMESEDSVPIIASLASGIINMAKEGNEHAINCTNNSYRRIYSAYI